MQQTLSNPVSILGIDLSGPANHADTCLAWRDAQGMIQTRCHASDQAIVDWVSEQAGATLVLIDAPLSYQDGGGYRSCDTQLRTLLNQRGFHRLGVMAPTMTKMVYLTLRGIALAHQLRKLGAQVLETHPGASLILSGINTDTVYNLKHQSQARESLLAYWQQQGHKFKALPTSDHQLMAIQALLTGERWLDQRSCYWQCGDWLV